MLNSVPTARIGEDLSAAPTLLAVRANDVHVDLCGSRIWAGHADPYPRYTPGCTTSSSRSTRSSTATAPPAGPFSTHTCATWLPRLSSNAAYVSSMQKADRGDFGPLGELLARRADRRSAGREATPPGGSDHSLVPRLSQWNLRWRFLGDRRVSVTSASNEPAELAGQ